MSADQNSKKKVRRVQGQRDFPLVPVLVIVGVVFVVCVGFFFMRDTSDSDFQKAQRAVKKPVALSKARIAVEADMAKKLPAAENAMRVPEFSAIIGAWVMQYGTSGIAELKIGKTSFELVTTEDTTGRLRRYSRGDVSYDEKTGKLSLVPSRKAGAPDEINNVIYRILTMRAHDVFARTYSDSAALYFLASTDQFMAKDLHPLFSKVDFGGAPLLKFFPITEQAEPAAGRP